MENNGVELKIYLYQLSGDTMLVYDGKLVQVQKVGYPVPDCVLPYNGENIIGSHNIMKAILSYDIDDIKAFRDRVLSFDAMTFLEFKCKIFAENIGGGCPKRLQKIGKLVLDKNFSELGAYFCSICPFIRDDVDLPSEEYLLENKRFIQNDWGIFTNVKKYGFRNNMIVYTGISGVGSYTDISDFLKNVLKCCMDEDKFRRYNYITVFLTAKGTGGVVFSDSIADNEDMSMFYQRISGIDLRDGDVVCNTLDSESIIELSFSCTDKMLKPYYRKAPVFRGSYYREVLKWD